MNVHFIAIGGSAMHNLAIALKRKGAIVTGSDDEIFEPSRTRLQKEGILPQNIGWNIENITSELDAVIVGMHARKDNPELLKAQNLGLKIYSYPEFLYQQSKDKIRIVIAGSHGKTTITAMILHVAKQLNRNVDYMVGAQLEGYDCMVKLSDDAPIMILEGDEYLSSPIDPRPKFHLYKPTIALLSGIAWDHINVFPTFEKYVEQFEIFVNSVENTLIYNKEDEIAEKISQNAKNMRLLPYSTPQYSVNSGICTVHLNDENYPLSIFGRHNMQNLAGAMQVGVQMGISPEYFLTAMTTFKGASKRLEIIAQKNDFVIFKDFAHSPSKLKATINAVREQYPEQKLIACMELHTFSSLQHEFLQQYKNTMKNADTAIVYYNPKVVEHKKLTPISQEDIKRGFNDNIRVASSKEELLTYLSEQTHKNAVLLMMSSGTFDGLDFLTLHKQILLSNF